MRLRLGLVGCLLAGCLGGAVPQAPECIAYLDCIQALDSASEAVTNVDRFAAGGACWVNGETADLCTSGCARGLVWLRTHSESLPRACEP